MASTSPRLRVSASPRPSLPLITLLTDFGTSDYFVASMKGVILSINPRASLIDLSHGIPPQDIATAAFTLLAAYKSFPAGAIHLAVVDPGVGSARRAILAVANAQWFVGPDNGIFSYIFDRETDVQVFQLTRAEYFRQPLSATFHGRDLFAPVAAALSNGVRPEDLGERIYDPVVLPALAPERLEEGRLRGRILQIDHFGNCITNFTREDLAGAALDYGAVLTVGRRVIRKFRKCFSDAGAGDDADELFAIWGSAGFLELAAMNRSAAAVLKAQRGQSVFLSVAGKGTNGPSARALWRKNR